MKFTLSLVVLAVAASQAMAVVPEPIKGCTRNVTVLPTDVGCVDFAKANGCTFEQLLKWNNKLRPDCANLDVGHPLCVSITPGGGAGGNSTAPITPPTTTGSAALPSGTSAVGTKPSSAAAPGATSTPKAATSQSGAAGSQSSIVLAAAGVLVSVAYML